MKILPLPTSKTTPVNLDAIARGTVFSATFDMVQAIWYRTGSGVVNLNWGVFYETYEGDTITNVVLYPDAELHLNGK